MLPVQILCLLWASFTCPQGCKGYPSDSTKEELGNFFCLVGFFIGMEFSPYKRKTKPEMNTTKI
jgi:hypothetical protein